jgi:hypothetical protein
MRNTGWIAIVAALVFAAVIGGVAYNAGVANGIAQSSRIVVAAPGTTAAPMPYPYPYPYYGWYRPWGFSFIFAPFFFLMFCMMVARAIFGYRHGWYHHHRGGCGDRDASAGGAAAK